MKTKELAVLIFFFLSAITGSIYRMMYARDNDELLKTIILNLAFIGFAFLASYIVMMLKKKRKKTWKKY